VAVATLETYLRKVADSDGLLSLSAYAKAAAEFSVTYLEIERVILENGLFPLRYQRQRVLFGNLQQLRLLRAKVAIVGCGGLGGSLFEMLVRLGVGHLLVIDPDFFVESNLNRQLLATSANLGRYKVEVALERGKLLNPVVQVETLNQVFQTPAGQQRLTDCDLVFDALDSIPARLELADFCSQSKLMLIHGAVAGWYGQMVPVVPGSEKMSQIYPVSSSASPENGGKAGSATAVDNFAPTVNTVAALQVAAGLKYLLASGTTANLSGCFIDLAALELELLR
jgi:molybdopterin/thiamine biosynthesis adenylyltransferase